jgi:hypothetical protein
MFPRRLSVLMVTGAAGLALIGGCTSDKTSTQSAPPAGATASTPATATTTTGAEVLPLPPTQFDTTTPPPAPPTTPVTTATTPAADAKPNLAGLGGCTGCTVKYTTRTARSGISAALLVGRNDPVQRGQIATYNSRTGTLIDQVTLAGDYFQGPTGASSTVACDISFHCFVSAGMGAHSGVTTVVAVGTTGGMTVTTNKLTVNSATIRAQDLEGDGVDEVVGVINDCEPDCARGHDFWTAWKLANGGYIRMGCAAYDRKPRPPAKLDASVCPL